MASLIPWLHLHLFLYERPVKFFDPYSEIRMTRHNLPHWQQPGTTYFITFRLADSLPSSLLSGWREERDIWLAKHPPPLSDGDEMEYHRRFSNRIDQWLDAGHGSCLLREPGHRQAIVDSLEHFDGKRYQLLSWVIMPNHVHLCAILHPEWLLEKVLFTWKRRTAGEINRMRGVTGQMWMHDYFDRMIRDDSHFRNVVRYIRRNPAKAALPLDDFTLWESDLARAID